MPKTNDDFSPRRKLGGTSNDDRTLAYRRRKDGSDEREPPRQFARDKARNDRR